MPQLFNPGDVVVLKGGGPRMTVREVFQNGAVRTNWFDDKGKLYTNDFVADSLTLFVAPKES